MTQLWGREKKRPAVAVPRRRSYLMSRMLRMGSGEIVYRDLLPQSAAMFDELQMFRMNLVLILGLLAGEDQVQGDLIRLIHHRTRAANHPAHVKLDDARDGPQVLLATGNEFIGGFGVGGVGPENDDVRELACRCAHGVEMNRSHSAEPQGLKSLRRTVGECWSQATLDAKKMVAGLFARRLGEGGRFAGGAGFQSGFLEKTAVAEPVDEAVLPFAERDAIAISKACRHSGTVRKGLARMTTMAIQVHLYIGNTGPEHGFVVF